MSIEVTHTPKFAGQLGVRRLYHYEKFNADYLSRTLRHQKIHCSNPTNLNDPWDCKPWFSSRSLQDPVVFQKVTAWFRRQAKQPLRPDLKLRWEDRLRNDPKEQTRFMDDLSKGIQRKVSERRIYCLTSDPLSTLMWSHYADNHRGICLKFAVNNPLFSRAQQVLYAADYPPWLPHEFEAQQERTIEVILTKADDWRYEKEFRLISVPNAPPSTAQRVQDDFFSLPSGALKSIIVGCQGDYDAVKEIAKTHVPDLPVERAVRQPNQYRLEIDT